MSQPYGGWMDVRVDGKIERRQVDYVQRFDHDSQFGTRRVAPGYINVPVLRPGEAVSWSIGDSVPDIVQTVQPGFTPTPVRFLHDDELLP